MKRIEYSGNGFKQLKELFKKKPATGILSAIAAVILISLIAFSTLAKNSSETSPESSSAAATKSAVSVTRSTQSTSGTARSSRTTSASLTTSTAATTSTTVTVGAVVYKNTKYGFLFSLPEDWKGYSVLTDKWQADTDGDTKVAKDLLTGTEIIIRNPNWTKQNPWQDIPIMIFTIPQWNAVLNDELIVSVAPYPPTELGLNSKYVFAIPARYNYTDCAGIEEVEEIINDNALQAFEMK